MAHLQECKQPKRSKSVDIAPQDEESLVPLQNSDSSHLSSIPLSDLSMEHLEKDHIRSSEVKEEQDIPSATAITAL